MQKQFGPILVILLVIALAVAGWFYFGYLNTEHAGDASTPQVGTPTGMPADANSPNGMPQQGVPSKALTKPMPKPPGM